MPLTASEATFELLPMPNKEDATLPTIGIFDTSSASLEPKLCVDLVADSRPSVLTPLIESDNPFNDATDSVSFSLKD